MQRRPISSNREHRGYKNDLNNFGPSIGVAWQPNVQQGFLHTLLGDPNLATVRASYGRSYNEGGLSDYTGVLSHGPGLTANADRNSGLNNLVLPGDAATYGGNGYPVLLSQTSRLGPPPSCAGGNTTGCILAGVTYPQSIVFTNGVDIFDPNYQTSRPIRGASLPARRQRHRSSPCIMNKTSGIPANIDYRQDIYNAGFGSSELHGRVQEAQQNRRQRRGGKGATFAYTGIPGTSPLPIFLASYSAAGVGRERPDEIHRHAVVDTSNTPSLSFITPNIDVASTNDQRPVGQQCSAPAASPPACPRISRVLNPTTRW